MDLHLSLTNLTPSEHTLLTRLVEILTDPRDHIIRDKLTRGELLIRPMPNRAPMIIPAIPPDITTLIHHKD